MAKSLTTEQRQLRIDIVEFIAAGIEDRVDAEYYTDEQVAELTKQAKRIAKFLSVAN